MKMNKGLLHSCCLVVFSRYKCILQRLMVTVVVLQELYEIQQVSSIKGTVYKVQKWFQVSVRMLHNKIIWFIIHQGHQLLTVIDNGGPISPG